MPLSVWKQLSLPELTSTRMTLELADRSVAHPKGVAEDVFVKVGKFYFPADFVVVDYDVDPRVPLILGRPFLRTTRALIDVYGEELTLRVDDEAITFKVGQTSRYSRSYETVNQVNVIDVACEEYAQEVLGFLDSSSSGNPTPSDPIIASSSPSFTPFEGGDFILEEIETFLRTPEELSNLDDDYYDTEGDILYLEKLLNEDPSPTLPPMKNDDLKQVDVTMTKPSTEEPPELELKDLPSHLEYAFLEGTDKLPVIISKELKDEEKAALLKVLKSHKRAIAWKISDIKGIDPSFCTHKILMEDDFKLAVQHQRRVNPKIHEVIKKEVIKLLDAGLIYPISDSPWVSPVHCVPKKGGMTVVENEDNELIPTRLVTGWRVCIDYRKLNDATRKDHFPLPFMDQMLERLAGNEYYCFLDGFSGYFQIPIDPQDQEKTTIHFALMGNVCLTDYMMPFSTHDRETMEVFMMNFLVFRFFLSCHSLLDKMLKRCEDTNLVLNWEKCIFMVKEGIVLDHKISKFRIEVDRAKVDVIAKLPHPTSVKVYTDHSALKYLLAKKDAKPRLLRWILLLQEFDVIIHDKKGAENLAADHLSRLENPHQGDLEKKEITKTFPLETLGIISSHNDSSTPWFADIANYHAGNFVIPSGEIKVHIEVLSVLWRNRLPIPDGSLPLSSGLLCSGTGARGAGWLGCADQWAACEDWAAETVEGRLWRGVACWGTWGVEQAELHCWLLADCWSLLVRGSGLLIGWRRETGRGMGLMCLLLAAGGGGWLLAGRSCDWLGWAGWWEGVPDWCVGLCGLWLELRVAGLSLHIAGSGCGRGCEGGVWEAAVLISCGGRGVWVGGLTVDLAAGRLGRAGRLLVWGGWTSGRAEESAETGLRLWTGSWPGMV
ncbi:reverse transcriptase domain-containing protein [Tanacetum coccineum]|uniref:RNA-directed DNA polymerase n=1 Tax=Tanacetum coccineum TaxID=301880 RepID=A0ABQ5CTA0_9ASTR